MVDWRKAWEEWKSKGWATTVSEGVEAQREKFVQMFPWQEIRGLSLEEYALGTGKPDTFSWWLEHGTDKHGEIGGQSTKHGVFFHKKTEQWRYHSQYPNVEAAFGAIREGIYELAKAASEERYGELDEIGMKYLQFKRALRLKPLYLWFPERFVPVFSNEHLEHFLKAVGEVPEPGFSLRNRQLLAWMRAQPEFEGWDTRAFMNFLYGAIPVPKIGRTIEDPPEDDGEEEVTEVDELLTVLRRDKNVILNGPPGTGKTYLAAALTKLFADKTAPAPPRPQNWRDALALVLYRFDRPARVPEIVASATIREFAAQTGRSLESAKFWTFLGEHAPPDSRTVKVSNRRALSLFDKTESSAWYLIPAGREFVEQTLMGDSEATVESRAEFVTFHPSFGYEEFVEGIRPKMESEELEYEVRPGPFLRLARRALAAWREKGKDAAEFLLVVDEINRADPARVFGDLLSLLEPSKRLGREGLAATLPYSGDPLALPPNLLLLGTMNTADRSVAMMDLALRRRFAFRECRPRPERLDPVEGLSLGALLENLNAGIEALLGPDLALGHAFLMGVRDLSELEAVWRGRMLPQLRETFHGHPDQLKALLGDAFFEKPPAVARLAEFFADSQPPSRLRDLEGEPLFAALRDLSKLSA